MPGILGIGKQRNIPFAHLRLRFHVRRKSTVRRQPVSRGTHTPPQHLIHLKGNPHDRSFTSRKTSFKGRSLLSCNDRCNAPCFTAVVPCLRKDPSGFFHRMRVHIITAAHAFQPVDPLPVFLAELMGLLPGQFRSRAGREQHETEGTGNHQAQPFHHSTSPFPSKVLQSQFKLFQIHSGKA